MLSLLSRGPSHDRFVPQDFRKQSVALLIVLFPAQTRPLLAGIHTCSVLRWSFWFLSGLFSRAVFCQIPAGCRVAVRVDQRWCRHWLMLPCRLFLQRLKKSIPSPHLCVCTRSTSRWRCTLSGYLPSSHRLERGSRYACHPRFSFPAQDAGASFHSYS